MRLCVWIVCLVAVPEVLTAIIGGIDEDLFIMRGDVNGDGAVNVSDINYLQNFLFKGGPPPPCMNASDANDDGRVNQSDSIYLLNYLFDEGPPPPAPGCEYCGTDPTDDGLSCETNWCVGAPPPSGS